MRSYLEAYLKGFPENLCSDLDTLCKQLPKLLECYILLHKDYDKTANTKRLILSTILAKVCAEIYHQNFPESFREYLDTCTKKKPDNPHYIRSAQSLKTFFILMEGYKTLPKNIEEGFGKTPLQIKNLLIERLPEVQQSELMKYFITCCMEILCVYEQDYLKIAQKLSEKSEEYGDKNGDDLLIYCHIAPKDLIMSQYTNLILPQNLMEVSTVRSYISLPL